MEAQTVNALASVASHDETVRCLLAIELSKKSWIIAVNSLAGRRDRPLQLGSL
jgi:transposase